MADNKKNNNEDMSVDELVNRLRSNISSPETSEDEKEKTIVKKSEPDRDIASMLKKFMPEGEADGGDFELDETSQNPDEADFELVSDPEYEIDMPLAEDEEADEGSAFEIDEVGVDIFGDDFDEPEEEIIEDFIPEEDDIVIDAVSFDSENEAKKPKKRTGLFGFGKKKGTSLADGYARMLEEKIKSAEDTEHSEKTEQLSFDTEFNVADTYEAENKEAGDQAAISYDELMSSDMPDLELIGNVTDEAEMHLTEEKEAIAVSEMLTFENQNDKNEHEEEYFVSSKKPLAFDNEDETPIVPDESAFEDIGPSDISAFDADNADIGITKDEGGAAENTANEELDDKDINLMIALGYEDELEKAIGKDTVDEISENLSAEIVDFIDADSAYAYDGSELSSPDGFRIIGDRYKKEHANMKIRLLATGVLAFALLIFELLGAFGVRLGGALNIEHYPVVGIMLSLQLLVLACALSYRQIFKGLFDAVTFTPSPASIPSVAVLLTVVYDIIMALIAPTSGLVLYNFPAALFLVFLVLGDYFDLSREIRSFNTVATRRPKYAVMTQHSEAERTAEEEMMAIFSEEEQTGADEKVLETKKVGFVENYFRRTNIRSSKSRNRCLMIFPFVALAIALGIVSYVVNRSGITAFNIAILTVLFGMPMSAMFIGSFPFFGAVKAAFENDATIIGEESIEEYSDASRVIFTDKEVFPLEATVTRGIKLFDNNAIYYVLYHLASLYTKIGGPLKERLIQATTELGYSEDVEILSIAENGIEAMIDGKVHVLAGKEAYMAQCGIDTYEDPDDDKMRGEGATALYLVLDGVLSAKLYVRYDIDPELENVISILAGERMETVIRTCDPNIDDMLLASRLRNAGLPIRIIRGTSEDHGEVQSADSGIVSRSSLTALARAVALCNKIRRVRKTSKSVSIASMLVSTFMMIFLSLLSSELVIPSVYVALYQIFWMIPNLLFTKLFVK